MSNLLGGGSWFGKRLLQEPSQGTEMFLQVAPNSLLQMKLERGPPKLVGLGLLWASEEQPERSGMARTPSLLPLSPDS